jgi:AcrR family transcriptional regulator
MMSKPTVSDAPADTGRATAADRLFEAALESFSQIGYHATTTRDIAERAGMSPAAVYVHYRSKLELLAAISKIGHESARVCLENALAVAGSHHDRITSAVSAFAGWHAHNQTLARVVQYEYRALPNELREEIKVLRRQMQADVEEEVRDGVAAGEFSTRNPAGVSLAIISLCVDVARWYSPKSVRSPEQLGDLYAQLALTMLTADSQATADSRSTTADTGLGDAHRTHPHHVA